MIIVPGDSFASRLLALALTMLKKMENVCLCWQCVGCVSAVWVVAPDIIQPDPEQTITYCCWRLRFSFTFKYDAPLAMVKAMRTAVLRLSVILQYPY